MLKKIYEVSKCISDKATHEWVRNCRLGSKTKGVKERIGETIPGAKVRVKDIYSVNQENPSIQVEGKMQLVGGGKSRMTGWIEMGTGRIVE